MAIYKRHNKWGISYRDPDGKWVRKLLDGATKKEAEVKLGEVKRSILLGSYWEEQKKVADPTFGELAEEFLQWHEPRKNSREGYTFAIRPLIRYFGRFKVGDITSQMVEGYQETRLGQPTRLNGRSVTASTVNHEVSLLRTVFNYAIKHGKARVNPVVGVKPLTEPPLREAFLKDDESIAKLIEAASERDREHLRPLIIAALQTGCRFGELVGMRWEDVDLKADPGMITIRNTKNNTSHNVVLDSVLRNLLRDQREWQMRRGFRSEWIFCGQQGAKLQSVKNSWKKACKKAGLADENGKPLLRFHDLRHTFASRHVMAGTPLFTVSKLLNHKNPNVVNKVCPPVARVSAGDSSEERRLGSGLARSPEIALW